MNKQRFASIIYYVVIATLLSKTSGFTVTHSRLNSFIIMIEPSSSKTQINAVSTSLTVPSQEESVKLGIREWPQQTKSQQSWDENVKENDTLTRYILQGEGDLTIITTSVNKEVEKPEKSKFKPGLLIEVNGPATLQWVKAMRSDEDVIILTPGYEQGGLLIGFLFGSIILCGALIAGVGS
mmetsp:Transcript_5116/g.6607  ORF Transcript_5116/g.6607 Transcript_5116/m.6607 type:complete len:181 (+) Transcript_5116:58-600(+)